MTSADLDLADEARRERTLQELVDLAPGLDRRLQGPQPILLVFFEDECQSGAGFLPAIHKRVSVEAVDDADAPSLGFDRGFESLRLGGAAGPADARLKLERTTLGDGEPLDRRPGSAGLGGDGLETFA